MITIYPMNSIGIMSAPLWLIRTVFRSAYSDPPDSHAVISDGHKRLIRNRLRQLQDSLYEECELMLIDKYLVLSIILIYSGKAARRIPTSATGCIGRSWAIGRIFMRSASGRRLRINQYRVSSMYPEEIDLALGRPSGIVACGQ